MNMLLATPYGPTTTLGRNVASVSALIAGLACLVLPSLQGVPLPNALFFCVLGLLSMCAFVLNSIRWKRIVKRAARESHEAGASSCFAYMQAEFAESGTSQSKYVGSGWVLIFNDRFVITPLRSMAGIGGAIERREFSNHEVAEVYRREATSMSYATLVLVLRGSDNEVAFTLTPENGSGLRGPHDEEIDRVVAAIRSRLEQ